MNDNSVNINIGNNFTQFENFKDEIQNFDNLELDYDKEIDLIVERIKKILSKENFITGGYYQFSLIVLLSLCFGICVGWYPYVNVFSGKYFTTELLIIKILNLKISFNF